MLESIICRVQNNRSITDPIDIGLLFEAMIFYGSTKLFGDRGVLEYVVKRIGPEIFLELVSEGFLIPYFVESMTFIDSVPLPNNRQAFRPRYFTFGVEHPMFKALRNACIESVGKEGKGRRLATRIETSLKVLRHEEIVMDGTLKAITNTEYLEPAVRQIIADILPNADVSNIRVIAEATSEAVEIATNIDFSALNAMLKLRFPDDINPITVPGLLSQIMDVECDMYFASRLGSEISTTAFGAKLISARASHLAQTMNTSKEQLSQFQEHALSDTLPFREAINSGVLPFPEALELLKASRKFKHWISGMPFDAKLVAEYIKEITKESISDKLPSKFVRWAIFLGVGFAVDAYIGGDLGKSIGANLGAFDSFLVDKLIKGWKPNQFIDAYKLAVKK